MQTITTTQAAISAAAYTQLSIANDYLLKLCNSITLRVAEKQAQNNETLTKKKNELLKQDLRSQESAKWRHLYKQTRWIKARARFLRHNPLCVFCAQEGIAKGADVVDHKKAHKGDQKLFWDEGNWQPLCYHHHNSTKQSMEKSGPKIVTGLDGWPVEDAA